MMWSESKPRRINRGDSPDHSPDRNSAGDATGARAANDIRPHDGSAGSGSRDSSKVCPAGIPD